MNENKKVNQSRARKGGKNKTTKTKISIIVLRNKLKINSEYDTRNKKSNKFN